MPAEQIIDMGDRDKGEPTIELIEAESFFQSTLMDSKFVRKSVSEVLLPRATCVASSTDTPSNHAHFSRFTSWWLLTFWHHEQEQSFYSSCFQVCRSGICRTTTPMFLCCARKNQEKLSRLPLGESVRIEGSSWQPCTTIRFLRRQDPTCANNFDLEIEISTCAVHPASCCLVIFQFLPHSIAASNRR